MNLEKYVWDGLNTLGKTISQIESEKQRSLKTNLDHKVSKDAPIWHTKSEIDRYVEVTMNLRLVDYGSDMSSNRLYKAIAQEIGSLRRKGILIDWNHIKTRNTGMGVWRLDKTKLERHMYNKAKLEMKEKNFRSEGFERMVFVRQKQNVFRETLLKDYTKCALCMFKIREYLIGAHIVPYSVMRVEEPDNAMNPSNGLLLCRFCDVAFERGSIRVSQNFDISIIDTLRDNNSPMISSWLESIPSELCVEKEICHPPHPKYLEWKSRLLHLYD